MPRRSRSDNSARRVVALPQASLRQALSKRFKVVMRFGEFGQKAKRFLELAIAPLRSFNRRSTTPRLLKPSPFQVEIAGFVESGCSFAEPALMR